MQSKSWAKWFPNWGTCISGGTREVSRGYMELLQNQNKTIISIMLCGHHSMHSMSEQARLIEQSNECVAVCVLCSSKGREEVPLINWLPNVRTLVFNFLFVIHRPHCFYKDLPDINTIQIFYGTPALENQAFENTVVWLCGVLCTKSFKRSLEVPCCIEFAYFLDEKQEIKLPWPK